MTQASSVSKPHSQPQQPQPPLGGALIDNQGREIPITEGMIHLACQALEKNCVGAARA